VTAVPSSDPEELLATANRDGLVATRGDGSVIGVHNRSTYCNHGCRCPECCQANYEYHVAYRMGRQPGLVPAQRAKSYVDWLRSQGCTLRQIVKASGVSYWTVQSLAAGTIASIAPRNQAKLLAVMPAAAIDGRTVRWNHVPSVRPRDAAPRRRR
jgi:hypothetical protein